MCQTPIGSWVLSADVEKSKLSNNQFQQLKPQDHKKEILNLITKPLLTSTMLAYKEGTSVEVEEGLLADQESDDKLSMMWELLAGTQ